MDKFREYTKTQKGLVIINLLSIVGIIVFFILIPAMGTLFMPSSGKAIYFASLIFTIFNLAYYVLPQSLKA